MHPKKLLDICIDAIVRHTRNIQYSSKDIKEKYKEVKQVWDEFWQLPQRLPEYAGELLRSHLFNPSQDDFTLELIVGLAANLKSINFLIRVSSIDELTQTFLFEECNVFCEDYQLQELHVPYIGPDDRIEEKIVRDVLIRLLPRCPSLTVLKLNSMISEDVLVAAKTCPLIVLQIGMPSSCLVQLNIKTMKKIIFGMPDLDLNWALMKMKGGENPNLKPTWPNLVDLSIGVWESVARIDFLLLVLLTHKKLQYIDSQTINIDEFLERYVQMKRENPQLVCESLQGRIILSRDNMHCIKTYTSVFGGLESLWLYDVTTLNAVLMNILQKFADASLFPKKLVINYLVRHRLTQYPKGIFSAVGKNVEMLSLKAYTRSTIDYTVLGDILLDLPAIKELDLSWMEGCLTRTKDRPPRNHCFPNITSLSIFGNSGHEYDYIFKMLPNLQAIKFSSSNLREVIVNLKLLPALRILKLCDLNQADISELIELPRNTQDGHRFELYAHFGTLSEWDINRIQNSGWNVFICNSDYYLSYTL